MGYKRAEWHSGLTYQQTCENCKTIVQYTDYSLDFRPWYADGFVYCPRCRTPMRHNENYAIDAAPPSEPVKIPVPSQAPAAPAPAPAPAPAAEPAPVPAYTVAPSEQSQDVYAPIPEPIVEPAPDPVPAPTPDPAPAPGRSAFCTACGNKFAPDDRFCPMCGNKRD